VTITESESDLMLPANIKKRVKEIIRVLKRDYPDAKTELAHENPLQLLVAVILSAQCTDTRVNQVTKPLFHKYKKALDYARADISELEEEIRSTGFFRNKARAIKDCCRRIADDFGGKVPDSMEDLLTLSGVGRKTANVILGNAYGIPGIVVDTHVKRLSGRLGLTENKNPDKIEFDLMPLVPKKEWTLFSHLLIFHGRRVCKARRPQCDSCGIFPFCPTGQELV
jgi:endonuclease-3